MVRKMDEADWDHRLVFPVPAGCLFCMASINSDGFEVKLVLLGCVLRRLFLFEVEIN